MKPRRRRPDLVDGAGWWRGLPSTIMKGGMSWTIFEQPPVIECSPMRQNWCTAESPENDGVVLHQDVSAEGAVVGEDDVVADLAVVGDVGVAEEVVVGADPGGDLGGGAAVDGAIFAGTRCGRRLRGGWVRRRT